MSSMMKISQNSKHAMRNPWVLGWLGLLITVIAVNVIFIVTAFNTNPGLVDEGYYEKGRDVEKNFHKKMEARSRLGWDMQMQVPEEVTLGTPANYSINIVDRIGRPLKDAVVTLKAYRPSDASADFQINMEMLTAGIYQSRVALPLKGIWDLRIMVSQGEDTLEVERRINVLAQ